MTLRSSHGGVGKGRIRNTLLINLSLIGLVSTAALFFLLSATINSSFSDLEERELQGHLGRVADFQKSSLRSAVARAKDWGIWDDSYVYAQDFNASYEASNVNAESFSNALVDGMAIVRFRGNAARAFAFDRNAGEPMPALAAALQTLVTTPDFVQRIREHDVLQSFVSFKGQLYTLAAVQLRRSDGSGASPGFLTFIQKIDSAKLNQALQVATEINLRSHIAETTFEKRSDTIEVETPFKDLDGRTVATIRLHLKRPLVAAARELLFVAFAGVLLLILILLVVLSRRMRTLVLDPVERLHAHVGRIRESGDLHAIEGAVAPNELGALQTEFNRMTTELQQLRAQLESQSFTLGKSQSAVGLMHNLRNCLSPVRVILESIEQNSADPLPAQTPRALRELADGGMKQERRDKLIGFLSAAHDHIGAKHAVQRQQVREAARNLMNALDAIDVAAQNERDTRFDERCDLAALLGHSANIARYAEKQDILVEVESDGPIAVSGNRVLLSQVLENLVANAIEAIRETDRADGCITLIATHDENSGRCTVVITDNGAGFGPEAAAHLFERGFSTRVSKSGGLGLHWCANTVRAMDGELTLESDGKGTGARATMHLPLWLEQTSLKQAAA